MSVFSDSCTRTLRSVWMSTLFNLPPFKKYSAFHQSGWPHIFSCILFTMSSFIHLIWLYPLSASLYLSHNSHCHLTLHHQQTWLFYTWYAHHNHWYGLWTARALVPFPTVYHIKMSQLETNLIIPTMNFNNLENQLSQFVSELASSNEESAICSINAGILSPRSLLDLRHIFSVSFQISRICRILQLTIPTFFLLFFLTSAVIHFLLFVSHPDRSAMINKL